ncbi:MAG: DUF2306 domain-containing protein [Saprospiraceae bacterium]|nr:DUF2306 domain-containing protein [Saprospiraceae bacterium]
MKRIILAILAIVIGLYPLYYLVTLDKVGLLQTKSDALWAATTYKAGFYTHVLFGGIAMLLGWAQFMPGWRRRFPQRHRQMGKGYVLAAIPASLAGVYLSFYAEGGLVGKTGFFLLGWIFLITTLLAYSAAKKQDFVVHERWMYYSYAACFAAVTLRLWMPILVPLFGSFTPAYQVVAWLCWVPNMLFAWWKTRHLAN